MKRVLFFVALFSLSRVAASDQPHGASWKDVRVTEVTVYTTGGPTGKGYLVVTFSSNGTGTPSCASGYPRNLLIDVTTDGGRMAAATVMQARALGSALGMTLTVIGTGTCSLSSTTETMASIQISERGQ